MSDKQRTFGLHVRHANIGTYFCRSTWYTIFHFLEPRESVYFPRCEIYFCHGSVRVAGSALSARRGGCSGRCSRASFSPLGFKERRKIVMSTKIVLVLLTFRGLALGCIEAVFCKQLFTLHHFEALLEHFARFCKTLT